MFSPLAGHSPEARFWIEAQGLGYPEVPIELKEAFEQARWGITNQPGELMRFQLFFMGLLKLAQVDRENCPIDLWEDLHSFAVKVSDIYYERAEPNCMGYGHEPEYEDPELPISDIITCYNGQEVPTEEPSKFSARTIRELDDTPAQKALHWLWLAQNTPLQSDKGRWSFPSQMDNQFVTTDAFQTDYDRLLLRAFHAIGPCLKISRPDLLSSQANGFFAGRHFEDWQGLWEAVQLTNFDGEFQWPSNDFRIKLVNGVELLVFADRYKQGSHDIGQVWVKTPSGMYIEEFIVYSNGKPLAVAPPDVYLSGSAAICKESAEARTFFSDTEKIRKSILCQIADAIRHPIMQRSIDGDGKAPTKKKRGNKIKVPKGNPLYGKL